MTFPFIRKKVKILPNDEVIMVELEFETLLLCKYHILVNDPRKNHPYIDKHGDNLNDEDDKYPIGSGKDSIGRKIWVSVKIFDLTGDGGDYEIKVIITQNGVAVEDGVLTTTKRKLKKGENLHEHYFLVQLVNKFEKEKDDEK